MAPHSSTLAWKTMDRGAWWAAVHGVEKSLEMTEQFHFHFSLSCTGEENDNPLQCSCLENPRDGGAWWAAVYGVAQSRTRLKRFSSSRAPGLTFIERTKTAVSLDLLLPYIREGNGTPLQYSCLENPMDGGA